MHEVQPEPGRDDRSVLLSSGMDEAEVDEILERVNRRKQRLAEGDKRLAELLDIVMAAAFAIREPVSLILSLSGDEVVAASKALKESAAYEHYQLCWQALDAYELGLESPDLN